MPGRGRGTGSTVTAGGNATGGNATGGNAPKLLSGGTDAVVGAGSGWVSIAGGAGVSAGAWGSG